jgi:pyruvate/2-oxoglutarate dehydrogenase complex dihydrolipoamide dehydrogenase (E3) component
MSDATIAPEDYDLVVLGSGEAGKYIGWTLAKQGKKVAVVERRYVGGSCPNIACLPSKNVIHSAKVVSYLRQSPGFGAPAGDWPVDMTAVRERKRRMVNGLVDMHLQNFQKTGAELVLGTGRFVGPKVLEVTTSDGGRRLLRGERVVISTGSRARIDPGIPGLIEAGPLTHIEALELDRLPGHLVVLGGGYIGLEFAQAMRRFGSRVTVIERNDRLVHNEDEDVSTGLHDLFRDEGIEVLTGAKIVRVEGTSGQSVKVFLQRDGAEEVVEGTDILAATGRLPNTDGIGLELAGVEITDRGFVKVNERLETTASGVWAVGDCAGSPHFTHIAYDDFRVVRDNLAGIDRVTTGRQIPFCMFTDPELARIGLSETEARARGIAYRIAKIPIAAALRSRTLDETRGFMKALVEAKGDRILGVTIFGVEAGTVIATVQVAMLAGMPYTALRDAILTHPTMPEGLVSLFAAVPEA